MYSSQTSYFKSPKKIVGINSIYAKTYCSLTGEIITAICMLTFWLRLFLVLLVWGSWIGMAQAEIEYRFERKWPQLEQPWYFDKPALAFGPESEVFAINKNIILVFSRDGRFVRSWGWENINDSARQWWPSSIAISDEGEVFVSDTWSQRVFVFDRQGTLLRQWGGRGDKDGLFGIDENTLNNNGPRGIAISSSDEVFVADTANHRIQVFDKNGKFLRKWGELGSAQGQFYGPGAIAINASDEVFVIEHGYQVTEALTYKNYRVQVFDTKGKFLRSIGSKGIAPGQFLSTSAIAITPSGHMYLTNSGGECATLDAQGNCTSWESGRVQVFDAKGIFQCQWPWSGPQSIAINKEDAAMVSEYHWNERIQLFQHKENTLVADEAGQCQKPSDLREWGSQSNKPGQFHEPMDIAINGKGEIYVADAQNNRIQVFDNKGVQLRQWGQEGGAEGEFKYPVAIAVSQQEEVFVSDFWNGRIQVFDDKGNFLRQWSGFFDWIGDIAVTNKGEVYVADTYGSETDCKLMPISHHCFGRIQVFDKEGRFLRQVGKNGIAQQENLNQVWIVNQIAISSITGEIFVAASGHSKEAICDNNPETWDDIAEVRVFDSNDQLLPERGFGGCDSDYPGYEGDGYFGGARSIAINSKNEIFVGDNRKNQIQVFNSTNGKFLRKFGAEGSSEGQFFNYGITGIAIGANDKIYIADQYTNRIQVFKPIDNPDHSKAIIVAAGGINNNELWTATELNASYAYRTLRSQGFNKEEVYYLSSNKQQDLDFNGKNDDIADVPSKANLEAAILTWTTKNTDTDNLILYLIDHGGDGSFRLSATETLSVAELDTWLDHLEIAIPALKQITIIIDACESGSFIKPIDNPLNQRTLAGPKRRLITSAQVLENAYFLTQGSVSFSNYFWTHLFHGNDLRSAFDHASEVMSAYQTPQVDFNGNGLTNEGEDLALMNNRYIGNGIGAKSSAPLMTNAQATPAAFTASGGTSIMSADIADGDGILDAYAIVRTPDFNPGAANNTITNLPKIPLRYSGTGNHYESNGYWNTDAQGNYRFNAGSYPFNQLGTYVLTLYAEDTNYNASEPKQLTVTVDTGKHRRAVIVEGYGAGTALTGSFKDNAKLAHDALVRQGYSEDNLYYLSGTGFSGVDRTATTGNLEDALTQWGLGDTEDLTVYLIADRAQINNEPGILLSANEGVTLNQLKQWLDTRQSSSGFNQNTGLPYSGLITVIMDACYSGEIINTLNPQGKRRILISSTTADGAAHFTNHTLASGKIFSTELSFSRVFWQKVQHGANLRDAFSAAGNAVNLIVGEQTPQLDDNFNGLGNDAGNPNITPVLAKDGDLARKISLGYGIFAAEDQPRILDHTPSGDVQTEQVNLDMHVVGSSTISDAWVIITRPDYSPDCSAYDQLPKLHLTPDPNNPDHWNADYRKFNVNGDYKITFYAIDKNGQQSEPARAIIARTGAEPPSGNAPEQAISMIVNDAPQTHALETADDQDWFTFYAQQGQTYTVEAKNVGADIDVGLQLYNEQVQRLVPRYFPDEGIDKVIDAGQPGEREIFDWKAPADGFYFIKVSNRGNSTGTNNQYQLSVYTPNAEQSGSVKGKITDSCLGATLGGVQVKVRGTAERTVSYLGDYGLSPPAVDSGTTYTIDINATGYSPQNFTLTVQPGQFATHDIQLTPVGACPVFAPTCTAPQILQDNQCVIPTPTCTAPQILQDNQCVTPIPTCIAPQILQDNQCVIPTPTCTAPQILQNNQCVTPTPTCIAPQILQNNQCVTPTPTCIAPQILQNNQCVTPIPTCSAPQILQDNQCVTPTPTCIEPQILQNGICITLPINNTVNTPPVDLPANNIINNQTINSQLRGNPQAPIRLTNSIITGSAVLSYVTIGEGCKVDAKATLQEGVLFIDNSLIPGGIDLTQAFAKVENSQPAAIKLNQDIVINSHPTLLKQIQNIGPLSNVLMIQNEAGLLNVQVGAQTYTIRPVQVTQALPGTPAGVSFTEDGAVQITTAEGRQLTFTGSLNDIQGLQQSLAVLGFNLNSSNSNNGNLSIGSNARKRAVHHFAARPGLYTEPATIATTPGLYLIPYTELSNVFIAYQVFEQQGQLKQQALLPTPEDWSALKTALQQPRFNGVRLNPDGIIQVDINQQRYRGLMNYPVYTGDSNSGNLRFEGAGDLNNDGLNDLTVIYPDGQSQELLLFPMMPLP